MEKAFKVCSACAHRWAQLEDWMQDENLYLNGYQASFDDVHEGLFLFTHTVEGCGTTLAIPAGKFRALYDGPAHPGSLAFTEKCNNHCVHEDDFESCNNECRMKWIRDILQILKNQRPGDALNKLTIDAA